MRVAVCALFVLSLVNAVSAEPAFPIDKIDDNHKARDFIEEKLSNADCSELSELARDLVTRIDAASVRPGETFSRAEHVLYFAAHQLLIGIDQHPCESGEVLELVRALIEARWYRWQWSDALAGAILTRPPSPERSAIAMLALQDERLRLQMPVAAALGQVITENDRTRLIRYLETVFDEPMQDSMVYEKVLNALTTSMDPRVPDVFRALEAEINTNEWMADQPRLAEILIDGLHYRSRIAKARSVEEILELRQWDTSFQPVFLVSVLRLSESPACGLDAIGINRAELERPKIGDFGQTGHWTKAVLYSGILSALAESERDNQR